ncbi:Site-specific recombinase XerD, partial [human gut metagenome]
MMKSTIVPWFRKTGVTITELTAQDIQDFYTAQLARVKSNTVIHYHALIHRALKYAVKTDQLSVNPADKVDRPRKNGFQPAFYDKDEINQLLACVKGTLIETPVMLAAFYGLRRSEAVGLRWNAIDFQQNTITIQHTVIACRLNGKYEVIARDTTKTKSSRRTLPL